VESLKSRLLRSAYRLAPFDLKGDGWFTDEVAQVKISCVINFYGRLDLLGGILYSLVQQDYPKDYFEVILVEDQGGTEQGRAFCESFSEDLTIRYFSLDQNFGQMGYSRNFGLSKAVGQYVLFLDDDTVILQPDFLTVLAQTFEADTSVDAIMPHGNASFALWHDRYDFHDPFFLTSRCAAYRRAVLQELGGFMSSFVGQEDVEYVIRFTIAGKRTISAPQLNYYHPPLLVPNKNKPAAVGISFARLRGRYSWLMLWLVGMNCSRHLLLFWSRQRKYREMTRFGIGFLSGFVKGWFRPDAKARYG
jgi:GT2 family glycosyltransferase